MGKKLFIRHLLVAGLLATTMLLTGCSGDDGSNGASGLSAYQIAVRNGFTGTEAEWVQSLQGAVEPESCSICHNGNIVRNGDSHQAAYDELFQHGVVQVTNVAYNLVGTDDVVTFTMTKKDAAGVDQPFDCTMADSLNIYFTEYTGVNDQEFTSLDSGTDGDPDGDRLSIKGTVTSNATTGLCTSTNPVSAYGDLGAVNGLIVVYGQDEFVSSPGSHITLARYPFAALYQTTGGVVYASAANATGCEHCHTKPYYKHGYILADPSQGGGDDFYTCKACHIDNGSGGHASWQISVDNPQRWAALVELANAAAAAGDTAHDSVEENMTPAELTQYAYRTRLMNDVHMSHSMEFPYPQSMENCNTCHEGKLTQTLSDANFVVETCKSCHPITGGTDTANADGVFAVDTTGKALRTLMPAPLHDNMALDGSVVCSSICHVSGNGIGAPLFSDIHTGYNPLIYDETTGNKYADNITASIDSVTVTGTDLDIKISAAGSLGGLNATAITPIVQVSFYGYDTKDFIISNHTRDANGNRMEKSIGSNNALFTEVDGDGSDGNWEVILHMADFVAPDPAVLGSITDLIASGVIKQAEVAFRPELEHPTETIVDHSGNVVPAPVGLNAVSKTVNVTADGVDPFVAGYYNGANALVSVDGSGTSTKGCNSCHDQLATTFHSGDRGGSIVVCRMCHVVTSGGSHLEGQSRSIDSYVHAIHRFQAFDVDEVDFTDPVEKALYEEHVEFLFPDFATINCMACHNSGKFNVPDQSKSMPGVLSATDEIPGVIPATTPEVVVGPAARACGACHRAEFINENDAGGFASFNSHTKEFGYRVENDANDSVLYGIIDKIMSMFQ